MRHSIKYIYFLVLLTNITLSSYATHNRSGEITYSCLGGNTYKIRVTTYTNNGSGSLAADRCFQSIFIDNLLDSIVLPRVNGFTTNCTNNQLGVAHDGEDITPPGSSQGGYRKNIYEGTYTFQGSSWHILYMFDPNRNAGSNNIPNSVNVPFALVDTIFTSNIPGLNSNNSPVLTFPPIDQACGGQIFIHNPGAYDPDQDSLSYSLTTCLGVGGSPIPGYTPPSALNVTINNFGDLIWNYPTILGEYNFAILITEWRKDIDGVYHIIGKTLRDLQVNVQPCKNRPPKIKPIKDTCIVAGIPFTQIVMAYDTIDHDLITLTANGGPFNMSPAATFTSTPKVSIVNGTFSWTPNCGQASKQPYLITFKAEDNSTPVKLVDFQSFYIHVVSPPPKNVTATASGASIILNWQAPNSCGSGNGNKIVNYLIYRKNDCSPVNFDPCTTGVPSTNGYTQIGTLGAIGNPNPQLTFTDNDNGAGLSQGVDYSYLVVAQFADGSLSLASTQICQHLVRDVPIIINVSVDTTDVTSGKIWVRWLKPVLSTSTTPSLDTLTNKGPYEFRLMQHNNFTGTFTQVYSVSKMYFAQLNNLSDTTYMDVGLNTQNNPYTYKIDFYCNNQLKGSTQTASSVFLSATGLARRVQLNWTAKVPWINSKTFIYRQIKPGGGYTLIDSTTLTQYVDTGLVNGANYCYKVKTVGHYSDATIYRPLINWSEKVCATPVDKEAPCPPTITSIIGNCNTQITSLTWTNPNLSCCKDAVYYNLYYTTVLDSPMVKIDSFPIHVTSFQTDFSSSIAGCYAITAIDSFGNESLKSIIACVDNCPEYELPNIITINGDGINDFFIPVKNHFVKDIDLKIYNRWGEIVFETTDPAINWEGKNKNSKQISTDGTYFYVCEVHMIRYTGIETKLLKGFLQILKN